MELSSYYALKRLIGLRSLMITAGVSLVLAARYPVVGLDFFIGGLCGIANLYLSTRTNEKYLDGRMGRAQRALRNLQRVLILAAVPVMLTRFGPPWTMIVTYGGIFIPLVLYALELRRRYRMGET